MKWVTTDPTGCDRVAAIDFETTGLNSENERIVQIGVVVSDWDGNILETWSELVNPGGHPIDPEVVAVHGLTPEMLARVPHDFAHHAPRLASITENAYVIAHRLPFDASFWRLECARSVMISPNRAGLCTKLVAWHYSSGTVSSLRSALVQLDIPTQDLDMNAHDALHDSMAVVRLFAHLNGLYGIQQMISNHNAICSNHDLLEQAVPTLTPQDESTYKKATQQTMLSLAH